MKKDTRIVIGICIILVLAAGVLFMGQQKRTADAGEELVMSERLGLPANASDLPGAAGPSGTSSAETDQECAVYVSGAVKHPGLYRYQGSARVSDAIDAVGGFLKNADKDAVNLARLLNDGEQILVLTKKEAAEKNKSREQTSGTSVEGEKNLIDINRASLDELMSLPGIGEAKAGLIIEYRTEQGPFSKTEDLMNISGIKEGVYNKIKDLISV